MKVMIVGSGGREHALAWKLAQSPRLSELIAVPGNAGIAQIGRTIAAPLSPQALLEIAVAERVDLTVVGPEAPLVAGVVDLFEAAGKRIFGPRQAAARLEGSKRFAKEFMQRHGIPTARYESFTDSLSAVAYIRQMGAPIVVKDSNLAAGKGVTVAQTTAEAIQAARNILEAPEGGQVVIEAFLSGQEVSLLVFTDGETIRPMLLSQDYKQAYEGDMGPMTGGMGVVAPVPLLSEAQLAQIEREILRPTLDGLQAEGIRYQGVLYVGLMVTEQGAQALEYNVRFGDPEAQAVLPLLETDLLEVIEAVIEGRLHEVELSWRPKVASCVVMAAAGYPGSYVRHLPIRIPAELPEGVLVFHAGTELYEGALRSNGGRVLGVTALADTLEASLETAYEAVRRIEFPQAHYRRDIGWRLRGSRGLV